MSSTSPSRSGRASARRSRRAGRARRPRTSSRSATPRSPSTPRATACATSPWSPYATSATRTGCPGSPNRAASTARSTASPGTRPTASSSTTRTSSRTPGSSSPPRTRAEWLDVTEKLDNGGDQGIYLSGPGLVHPRRLHLGRGRRPRRRDGRRVAGHARHPEALRGMEFYKELQALGDGPKDADEADPAAGGGLRQGRGRPDHRHARRGRPVIEETNPDLKGKLGFFPIPGKTADRPGAVFTGGSDLIIPKTPAHAGRGRRGRQGAGRREVADRSRPYDELRAQQDHPRRRHRGRRGHGRDGRGRRAGAGRRPTRRSGPMSRPTTRSSPI